MDVNKGGNILALLEEYVRAHSGPLCNEPDDPLATWFTLGDTVTNLISQPNVEEHEEDAEGAQASPHGDSLLQIESGPDGGATGGGGAPPSSPSGSRPPSQEIETAEEKQRRQDNAAGKKRRRDSTPTDKRRSERLRVVPKPVDENLAMQPSSSKRRKIGAGRVTAARVNPLETRLQEVCEAYQKFVSSSILFVKPKANREISK